MNSKGLMDMMKLPNYSTESGERVDGIVYTFELDFLSQYIDILNLEQLNAIESYNLSPKIMGYTNATEKQYTEIDAMIKEYKFQLQQNNKITK